MVSIVNLGWVVDCPSVEVSMIASILFVAGDSPNACNVVEGLASDIGFEVVVMNQLSDARLLEPFAMIWISMAYKLGYGREFAFSMMKREE